MKSSIKTFGFYFAELIITTTAYIFLVWYFASQEYIFSSYNREISWLILILFGIGIAIIVYHLRSLYREEHQIARTQETVGNFQGAVSRLLQQKHAVSAEVLNTNLRNTVDDHFASLEPSLIKTRIYRLVKMMSSARPLDQDSLSLLMQQKEEPKGARVRYIAGILIMIGLLGTFLGLVQAIKYLQHFFTATESVDLTTLLSDMKQTLGGLDKAFGTSIGGITAYLVLGYLTTVLRAKQSHVLVQIEDLTVEDLLPTFQGVQREKPEGVASYIIDTLQAIPTTMSTQLVPVLEEVVTRTDSGLAEELKTTSASLRQAAEEMQAGQRVFGETLQSFGEFLATFRDSREQLLDSQQTVASGIQEFSGVLHQMKDNQAMLASSLDMTRNTLAHSESNLESMRDIVTQMHSIWTHNQQAFETMTSAIQGEHELLRQTTQRMETFLATATNEASTSFQTAQQQFTSLMQENAEVYRKLLESHSLLTTLLHDIKHFILDEQNGLRLLSASLDETFGDTRTQYLHLSDHLEELYKRIQESQEQLTHVQDTTTTIQQQLQTRRTP
ncbi:hypothetical protein GF339_04160 [candidate division KSB3 bacterium]|uniref:MotA/TolQ/ExbB proton channel domain-containing protein n=1 Tax=candidate division KSB3 bacterium TaxID=2044937 RepID=A0A9D5JT63_9BACT|nr:hypothetical protein [candidate division KSB3 bacterium]MBD3323753.1 hypothetical protein [candidate division KSB3 bacterium]